MLARSPTDHASRKTRSRSASSRASTTRSASSSAAPIRRRELRCRSRFRRASAVRSVREKSTAFAQNAGCPYSKLRKPRNPGISPTFSVLSRDRSPGALRLSPDNGHIADIAELRFGAMSVHRDFEMIKRNCSAAIRCAGPGNTSQCRLGRRALLLISIKALYACAFDNDL